VTFGRIGADEATVIEVSRCAAVEATRQEQTPESSTDPIVGYAERLAGGAHATSGTTGRVTSDAETFHDYRHPHDGHCDEHGALRAA